MKIINDDVAYVQKIDISNISTYDMPMPNSIFLMAIGEEHNSNDRSGDEFSVFTNEKEVEFFKNVDWILNYDEVINLEEEDIVLLIQELVLEKEKMINEFNFNSVESILNLDLGKECNRFDLLIDSLNYVLKIKKNDINIKLPDNIKIDDKKDSFKVLKKRFIENHYK